MVEECKAYEKIYWKDFSILGIDGDDFQCSFSLGGKKKRGGFAAGKCFRL